MIAAFHDISGFLSVVAACMAIGFFLWWLIRGIPLLVALVLFIVITIVAAIPLGLAFAFAGPPAPLPPRVERQNKLELRLYASSISPHPYDRDRSHPYPYGSNGINIPNHLAEDQLVSTIVVRYMTKVEQGEDACFSVEFEPPTASMTTIVKANNLPLRSASVCKSFAQPMSGFEFRTISVGSVTAQITIAQLPEFLKTFREPWQAQMLVNTRLLSEDVRGSDAWRNVRSVPFLRAVTLTEGNAKYTDEAFSINLNDGKITVETAVSPSGPVISESTLHVVLWTAYITALAFVSGAGWMLLEYISKAIKKPARP